MVTVTEHGTHYLSRKENQLLKQGSGIQCQLLPIYQYTLGTIYTSSILALP